MQAWVAALVIAVTLPLGALVFLNARQDAREEEEAAAEHAELLARQLAAATARFLADTYTLLERLKTRPAIRMKDPDACDPLFGEFAAHFPRYASLRRIDRNGEGVCASDEIVPGPHAYADLPGFRAVAAGERFHVDAPLRNPGSQRWVADAAIP